jgi:hypothetical protein
MPVLWVSDEFPIRFPMGRKVEASITGHWVAPIAQVPCVVKPLQDSLTSYS